MSITRTIHDALIAQPTIALYPIFSAMALVLLGNWLVAKHYRANGHEPPMVMGRPFHSWIPARETCTTTTAYRNAALATLVTLYIQIAIMVIMGVSFKIHSA